MSIREYLEQKERDNLSSRAKLSAETQGRERAEETSDVRTEFQRDRDRIIHSKAFRRLTHKTQVFLSPEGDHYRTRLTHTLEVSQISRGVARALRLNEDLAEAIALGHDLGHTPFGHIGEEALNETGKLREPFKHNKQSLRVIDLIEYEGKGLNLTFEVRDGILNHTGEGKPATLEGQIVRIADRIAYINHDIDDAIRAGVILEEDLPAGPLEVLGRRHSIRINNMVMDMIRASQDIQIIQMSPLFAKAMDDLRTFLFDRVYIDSAAKTEDEKAKKVLQALFFHYLENPAELPPEFQPSGGEDPSIRVCDYIAGMTDRYALRKYEDLFIPKTWMV